MTKKLIIKYLSGNASKEDEQAVLEWVNKNEDNLKYFITLKNLWIYQNMPVSTAVPAELEEIKKITNSSVHKWKSRSKIFSFLPYAAALIIILLGLDLFFTLDNRSRIELASKQDKVYPLSEIPVSYKHTLYTNNGVKGFVKLPDGTKVWLNSASKLVYPDKFLGSTREVEVSGEAFFDVTHNPQKPMIVSTNRNFKVKVLGTKFNIRSYDNDNEAQTTLFSGSIKLISKTPSSDKEVITQLSPTESFVIRDKSTPVLIKQIDTSKQIAWKEGKLIFESAPMDEVIKKLERWHGTEFIVRDKDILRYKITANFKSESIVQIMEMIKFCSLIDYSVSGNRVTIYKRS